MHELLKCVSPWVNPLMYQRQDGDTDVAQKGTIVELQ